MRHDDATLVTTRERTLPLVGGALCLRSFDAVQAAGQAAIGTTAMGVLQESMPLQVCQGPLHGAAGQLQVLRSPADAGPAGAVGLRRDGLDFFFRKLRHHLADQLMFTTEIKSKVISKN